MTTINMIAIGFGILVALYVITLGIKIGLKITHIIVKILNIIVGIICSVGLITIIYIIWCNFIR